MRRKILITSIIMAVAGFITIQFGDRASTVVENGVLQDSILMPIGLILLLLGLLVGSIVALWYLVDFVIQIRKNRD